LAWYYSDHQNDIPCLFHILSSWHSNISQSYYHISLLSHVIFPHLSIYICVHPNISHS
jgi:hypothetical protein